jgi:hypothetical protein
MTNEQARAEFDRIAELHRANGDHDKAAQIEVCREYFLNQEFRAAMTEYVWEIVSKQTK